MLSDRVWLWFLASGAALLLAQLFPFWWGLEIAGIMFFIQAVHVSGSFKQAVLGSIVPGLLNAAGGYAWLWHAFPIGWIDEYNIAIQFIFFGSFYAGIVFSLGLGMVVAAGALYQFRHDPVNLLWLGPLIWISGEVVGSFLLSLWLWGNGSLPNIDLAHGYAGVALSNWPLAAPAAALAGVYGLSVLTFLLAGAAISAVKDLRRFYWLPLLLLAVLIVLNIAYPIGQFARSGLRVIAVDTYFSRELVDNKASDKLIRDSMGAAIIAAASTSPDYILLPEEYDPIGLEDQNSQLWEEIRTAAPDFTGMIIGSAAVNAGSSRVLRSSYYDTKMGDVYHVDKRFLTAQGEYVTYVYEWLLKFIGMGEKLGQLRKNANFIPGTYTAADVPDGQPMVLMCFASASGIEAKRDIRGKEVPFIAHPVSHVRFRDPVLFWYQLRSLLRAQAVWTGKPIIVAANMSESRMYLPDGSFDNGRIIRTTPLWRLVEYHP